MSTVLCSWGYKYRAGHGSWNETRAKLFLVDLAQLADRAIACQVCFMVCFKGVQKKCKWLRMCGS